MKTSYLSAITLSLATLAAGQAFAADNGANITREQVRAELAQAQRNGTLVVDFETGRTLQQINPGLYPVASSQSLSRAQVQAELAQAQKAGTVLTSSEKLSDLFPHRDEALSSGKTRAEVRAELAEAQRTGDIVADAETGRKLNELYPNRFPLKSVH